MSIGTLKDWDRQSRSEPRLARSPATERRRAPRRSLRSRRPPRRRGGKIHRAARSNKEHTLPPGEAHQVVEEPRREVVVLRGQVEAV